MRLIDWARNTERRLAVPLAGYPGIQLTSSTIKQNEFNAELQARTLYKLTEQTDCDAIFTMMDLSIEAGALGLPVRFPLADSATIEWHPVRGAADLNQYKVINPIYDGRVWVFTETVRMLKRRLSIPIGVYVIGPFTLAGLMMGANDIAMATIESPEVVLATVNFAERVIIDYAQALENAGAAFISILDPTCVILSPTMFRQFCAPSISNVIRHLATPTMLHICGDTTHLIEPMCETGTQGLSLDSAVSLPQIAPGVPDNIVILGNVDPVATMLNGSREKVRQDTVALLDAMDNYDNFILSTGCDLPANTPIENIATLVETTKQYKRKAK